MARIDALAEKMRDDLGDKLTGREGKRIRPRATIFDISDKRLLIKRQPKLGVREELVRGM